MRFLRRLDLNRRAVFDNTLYTDVTTAVIMGSRKGLRLPTGDTSERPVVPQNGMIRYNESTTDVEVYQGDSWRALRYRESGEIVQQSVGVGDGENVYFGPLNPAPPATSQSGYTWEGKNLLVIVENVIQLWNTNYTVIQNPTLAAESYFPVFSAPKYASETRLYFNTGLNVTSASGTGTTVTLHFDTQSVYQFSTGSYITVEGMVPYEYNGTYQVSGCTLSTVSYVHTATGTPTTLGTVTSEDVVYPTISLVGATITGDPAIQPGSAITGYSTSSTGALVYIDVSLPITGTIPANTQLIIDTVPSVGSGYYLEFSSPVPPGKPVTVLHGFDK